MFETEDNIRKKVRSAVTDTGEPVEGQMSAGVENLFNLLKACGANNVANSLSNEFKIGTLKYSILKDAVADSLIELTKSFISKKNELMEDKEMIDRIIQEMSAKSRELAETTMQEVRKLTGLPRIRN